MKEGSPSQCIVVCGSRRATSEHEPRVRQILDLVLRPQDSIRTLLHGNCKGIDQMAARIARENYSVPVKSFPADWTRYGLKAGPIRNAEMLDHPNVILLIAFPDHLSKGTLSVLDTAALRAIPTLIYPLDNKFTLDGPWRRKPDRNHPE